MVAVLCERAPITPILPPYPPPAYAYSPPHSHSKPSCIQSSIYPWLPAACKGIKARSRPTCKCTLTGRIDRSGWISLQSGNGKKSNWNEFFDSSILRLLSRRTRYEFREFLKREGIFFFFSFFRGTRQRGTRNEAAWTGESFADAISDAINYNAIYLDRCGRAEWSANTMEACKKKTSSERVVLFGNGNIVVTREDIVHLTTEPRVGRESLWVHVMPNRYTQSLPFRTFPLENHHVNGSRSFDRDRYRDRY